MLDYLGVCLLYRDDAIASVPMMVLNRRESAKHKLLLFDMSVRARLAIKQIWIVEKIWYYESILIFNFMHLILCVCVLAYCDHGPDHDTIFVNLRPKSVSNRNFRPPPQKINRKLYGNYHRIISIILFQMAYCSLYLFVCLTSVYYFHVPKLHAHLKWFWYSVSPMIFFVVSFSCLWPIVDHVTNLICSLVKYFRSVMQRNELIVGFSYFIIISYHWRVKETKRDKERDSDSVSEKPFENGYQMVRWKGWDKNSAISLTLTLCVYVHNIWLRRAHIRVIAWQKPHPVHGLVLCTLSALAIW